MKDKQRAAFIKARVSFEEYRKLRKKAHEAYLPTYEYLRELVLKDIEGVELIGDEFSGKEDRQDELKRMRNFDFESDFDEEEIIVKAKLPLFGI